MYSESLHPGHCYCSAAQVNHPAFPRDIRFLIGYKQHPNIY